MQGTQHLLGGSNPSFVHKDRLGSPGGGRTRSLTPESPVRPEPGSQLLGPKPVVSAPLLVQEGLSPCQHVWLRQVTPACAPSPPQQCSTHPACCPHLLLLAPPGRGWGEPLLWCEWRGVLPWKSENGPAVLEHQGSGGRWLQWGPKLCPVLDVPAGQLPRGRRSHAKTPVTGMGFQEMSSDSGTQDWGQECGLGAPEGLAKCLLSLVDLG